MVLVISFVVVVVLLGVCGMLSVCMLDLIIVNVLRS